MNDYLAFRKMIMPIFIKIFFWVGSAVMVLNGIGMCFLWISGLNSEVPFRQYLSSSDIHFIKHGTLYIGLAFIFLGPLSIRLGCELLMIFSA